MTKALSVSQLRTNIEQHPANSGEEQSSDDEETAVASRQLCDLCGGVRGLRGHHGGGGEAQADGHAALLEVLAALVAHAHLSELVQRRLACTRHRVPWVGHSGLVLVVGEESKLEELIKAWDIVHMWPHNLCDQCLLIGESR